MPHIVVLYTPNLDAKTNMSALCRSLADALQAVPGDDGSPVFPAGGTRVLAYAANHFAVADGGAAGRAAGGSGDYSFVYVNLRMGKGRSDAIKTRAGDALNAAAGSHFEQLLATEHMGLTVQVDEGTEAFDAKRSSLHPLFNKR